MTPPCRKPQPLCARRSRHLNWILTTWGVYSAGSIVKWLSGIGGHHPLPAAIGGAVAGTGTAALMIAILIAVFSEAWGKP